MARRSKRKFSAEFKLKVALAALKEEKTITALCQEFELAPTQIKDWKQQLISHLPTAFENPLKAGLNQGDRVHDAAQQAAQEAALYEQIGRLKMELEWLKKKLS